MKYNRSEIMRAAWVKVRKGWRMSDALRMAWHEAKAPNLRYNVYGYQVYNDSRVLLMACCTEREAGECKWWNQYRYDRIDTTLAA